MNTIQWIRYNEHNEMSTLQWSQCKEYNTMSKIQWLQCNACDTINTTQLYFLTQIQQMPTQCIKIDGTQR